MTQVAADVLGIPPERVRAELGDSELPPAPVSGGSMTTASVMPAVKAAVENLLNKLKGCAMEDPASPLHAAKAEEIVAHEGSLHAPGRAPVSYSDVLRSAKLPSLEAQASVSPGLEVKKYAMHSFGAQFSEVRVDSETGEVRVNRHCAVFDVGRVINPKT